MSNIKRLIGNRIKELRKNKKLTQDELAEMVGIEPRNILKIENAQTFPRAATLDKIIEALEISYEYFFQFSHIQNEERLLEKIVDKLKKDSNLTKFIYKILF